MPKQLLLAKRPKRSEPRPLAECLPRININDLKIPKVSMPLLRYLLSHYVTPSCLLHDSAYVW